ncbi:MAG TPA: branched-chain amino acid ABC transporter permease [Piscinibacter sp.]|jgi:branched-chain amino acid transport system permease protein|nr:branched-chain amino acid ABC transporter permease [Piscinibacter sp.]HOY36664.1 branched-chain amino acid ABC transporter permease [Piscinibacter sp.]HPG79720.1 branched-chain amino acid ABC transporter permease [Piscinibacter sp.]HPM68569.1 branched-chain amino acid ABC transporter permease [Piscinibacter sp.]
MRPWVVPVIAALLLAALPAVLTPYTQDLVVKIAIYAVFALSLELLVGAAGLVSLGHAAFLGIGAYVTVMATGDGGAASALWLLPAAMGAAALYAIFVGALSLRTKGVYFIMVTLAFAQMAYFVFHDTKLGGGSDGIFLYSKPVIQFGKTVLLDLDRKADLYYTVLAALVGTYALLALINRSRFGHALAGIRVNEQRMRAAGFATYGYKLAAFVIAGALAGLAGFLLAVKDGAVNPELLSWHESGAVLLMIILGGIGSLRGAVIGAVAFTLLKELYQSEALLGPLAAHWQLTLGLTIIAFVALLPKGLIGLKARLSGGAHA